MSCFTGRARAQMIGLFYLPTLEETSCTDVNSSSANVLRLASIYRCQPKVVPWQFEDGNNEKGFSKAQAAVAEGIVRKCSQGVSAATPVRRSGDVVDRITAATY